MEKFDFDQMTERRGSGSMKWDFDKDPEVIPLWVADMDFRTAPVVTEALLKRVKTGIFGYTQQRMQTNRQLSASWGNLRRVYILNGF